MQWVLLIFSSTGIGVASSTRGRYLCPGLAALNRVSSFSSLRAALNRVYAGYPYLLAEMYAYRSGIDLSPLKELL